MKKQNKTCKKKSETVSKRTRKCKECGGYVKKKRIFCSPICRTKKSNEIITCLICNKTKQRRIEKRRKSKNTFCSFFCYQTFKKTPENNPNWKNGKKELSKIIRDSEKNRSLIKKILKRDKYTCKNCGQVGRHLQVDHIVKFSTIFDEFKKQFNVEDKTQMFNFALKFKPFWDENNLQTLCKSCNWKKETEYRKSQKGVVPYHKIR
jgi:5-methylcytosine-specific restriction endonuclease McrA